MVKNLLQYEYLINLSDDFLNINVTIYRDYYTNCLNFKVNNELILYNVIRYLKSNKIILNFNVEQIEYIKNLISSFTSLKGLIAHRNKIKQYIGLEIDNKTDICEFEVLEGGLNGIRAN